MDRDRDSRRPLDIPPEDRFFGSRGQSYRPAGSGARSPRPDTLRGDSYRARSPPPRRAYIPARGRSRSPPPRGDTYRRRSPSPRDRFVARGGDSYRRPRSPLPVRREDLPRDDLFRREPDREARGFRGERGEREFRGERDFRDEREYRDDRYAAPRSPPRYRERERSPLPLKRTREPSPLDSRGRRTPPPAKRERLASPPPRGRYDDYPPSRATSPPRRGYSPRGDRSPPARGVTRGYRRADSRSPVRRNDRFADPRGVDDWRRPAPRSPSPPRAARSEYPDYDDRGRESVATSRRSSPPVHPSRLPQNPAALADDRPRASPRAQTYENRDPYRARSPSLRERREISPLPTRERDYPSDRPYDLQADDRVPPLRASDELPPRAPPTGPAGAYRAPSSSMAPPPASSASISVSAHARPSVAPPSGPRNEMTPRGGFGGPRGRGGFGADFSPRGRGGPGFVGGRGGFEGGFATRGRGGAPGAGGFGRGQGFDREQQDFHAPHHPPSGPRGSFSSQTSGPPPGFRGGGAGGATTYPRTQRFGPGQAQGASPTGPGTGEAPTGPRAPSANGFRRPTDPGAGIPTGPSQNGSAIPSGPRGYANAHHNAPYDPTPLALRDLPKLAPGGEKLPPVADRARLDRLAEETERLRKVIEGKEERKRKVLREWERLGRESNGASVRSEVAEEALRAFEGGEGGEAF